MIRVPNAKVNVPAYHKMLWPTLQALKQMGGSGTVQEIMDRVIEIEGYSEAQQSVIYGKGPGTEIGYRLPWARTYLKTLVPSRIVVAASGRSPIWVVVFPKPTWQRFLQQSEKWY